MFPNTGLVVCLLCSNQLHIMIFINILKAILKCIHEKNIDDNEKNVNGAKLLGINAYQVHVKI